jgi:hypothetical protein
VSRAAPAVLLVALIGAGACGDGAEPAVPATTAAGRDGATTEAPASTAPAATIPRAGAEDWDGARFDFGILDRIDRTEDGRTLLVFDRVQVELGTGGPISAPVLTEEPIVYGNTDAAFVNENTSLRTYVAAADVEVLRISNLRETCADRDDAAEARWERVGIDDVVDGALWDEYRQVSLTFDAGGRVSRLRLSSGC